MTLDSKNTLSIANQAVTKVRRESRSRTRTRKQARTLLALLLGSQLDPASQP